MNRRAFAVVASAAMFAATGTASAQSLTVARRAELRASLRDSARVLRPAPRATCDAACALAISGGVLLVSAPVLAIAGAASYAVLYPTATVFGDMFPAFALWATAPLSLGGGLALFAAARAVAEPTRFEWLTGDASMWRLTLVNGRF